MGDKTGIEWADATWNPTTGCDRVSPGCDHCYALTQAKRLKAMGSNKYQQDGNPKTSGPGFGIKEHPSTLMKPLDWQRPRKIFVNSMSDLFHAGISEEFIAQVFAVMSVARWHTFQVLTKRHARMKVLLSDPGFASMVQTYANEIDTSHVVTWPLPNMVLGVSAENQDWADRRIPFLLDTPAAVRFVSAEPLLGFISFHGWLKSQAHNGMPGLDWVIVGGESGPGARPMHPDWVKSIRDECHDEDTAFLFKQWGNWAPRLGASDVVSWEGHTRSMGEWVSGDSRWAGMENVGKKEAGRLLDGVTYDGYPDMSVR